jgi:hypothetical protein
MPMTRTFHAERSPKSTRRGEQVRCDAQGLDGLRNQIAGAHHVADAQPRRQLHIHLAGLQLLPACTGYRAAVRGSPRSASRSVIVRPPECATALNGPGPPATGTRPSARRRGGSNGKEQGRSVSPAPRSQVKLAPLPAPERPARRAASSCDRPISRGLRMDRDAHRQRRCHPAAECAPRAPCARRLPA